MSIFSKKAKQEALPAPLLLSEAGKVHTETVFYTMPAKFLLPDKPPFWTAGKIWLGVAVLMAGFICLVDSGLAKTYPSVTTPLFTVVYPFWWSLERDSNNNDDIRFVGSPDEFISI